MLSLDEVRIEETGGNAVMPHGMRVSYKPDPTLYVMGNCRSEQSKSKMQRELIEKLTDIVATAMKDRPKPDTPKDDELSYMREQLAQQQAMIQSLQANRTQTEVTTNARDWTPERRAKHAATIAKRKAKQAAA